MRGMRTFLLAGERRDQRNDLSRMQATHEGWAGERNYS